MALISCKFKEQIALKKVIDGTNYQVTCKQSHILKLQELAKCAKTIGIASMMITSAFQITTQALRITLHIRI
jgi:hypothetical protein